MMILLLQQHGLDCCLLIPAQQLVSGWLAVQQWQVIQLLGG
jgi:hypothetical protein